MKLPEVGDRVSVHEEQKPEHEYKVTDTHPNPLDEIKMPPISFNGEPVDGLTLQNPLYDIEPIGAHQLPKPNPYQASELEIVQE